MNVRALVATALLFLLPACANAPRTVFVVRHAEAFKNLDPRPDLPPDQLDSLTPAGRQQARALGERLTSEPIDLVLTSPLGRTRQTAEAIARTLAVPVVVTTALRPIGAPPAEETASTDPTESLERALARALAIIRAHEGTLVLVTHGDIAALLIGEAAATPLADRPSRDQPPTGSVTEVELR